MKKTAKRIISAILTVSMLFAMTATTFAEGTGSDNQLPSNSYAQPRISQEFDFQLTSGWQDISFDYNLLTQSLVVSGSNFQNTLKTVQLRIVYTTGLISPTKTLTANKSVTFTNMPLVGWKLQARAYSGSGWAHFTIND